MRHEKKMVTFPTWVLPLDFWIPAVFIFCFSAWGLLQQITWGPRFQRNYSHVIYLWKKNNIFLQIMCWDVKCPRSRKLNPGSPKTINSMVWKDHCFGRDYNHQFQGTILLVVFDLQGECILGFSLQVGRYLEGQWAQMLCDNNCWNSAWAFLLQMCRWSQLKFFLGLKSLE